MMEKRKLKDNELLLPNGNIIILNDDQLEGIDKILKWLKNKNSKKTFTLSGYAGTGKTTVVKKIFDHYKRGVVVSAPTHKAKKVIVSTTKKDGITLQALLGLRPDTNLDEFNPNNPQFNPIAIPKINDYNLVVIDEASMINSGLFALINNKLNSTFTKVLYMGDSAQIPPISEKISPVFLDDDDEYVHHLTKVERQADGNPLFTVYDQLRNNLTEFNGGFSRKTNINNKGEGIEFLIDKNIFRDRILEGFTSKKYNEDFNYCKLIAWRNETVNKSNEIIRNCLFDNPKDIVVKDDVLMGYRTVSGAWNSENIIENSADYKVIKILPTKKNEYNIIVIPVVISEEIDKRKPDYKTIFIVDLNKQKNIDIYGETHDILRDQARVNKKLWKKYYDFRRENLLLRNIDTFETGLPRNAYDKISKDLDYGYAITSHKSQGSTYENVFVMENDINKNPITLDKNKILYVALSRPMNKATVLTTRLD